MGLDAVELVMEIEETFGISIPDPVAERLQTVGGVCDYLAARVGALAPPSPICGSQATFYNLRDALVAVANIDSRRFKPGARLTTVLDRRRLNELLPAMSERSTLRLPRVRRDMSWLMFVFIAVGVGAGIAAGLAAGFAACLGGFVVFALLAKLFESNEPTVDASASVRQWIRATQRGNGLTPISVEWTEARIFREVQTIFAEQLALPRWRIRRESHIIHDLNVD